MTQTGTYRFSESDAEAIAKEHYGLSAQASCLDSYIDQNFLLRESDGEKFILKVHNTEELVDVIDFQNQMMEHLASSGEGIECPSAAKNVSGERITLVEAPDGGMHCVRLLNFIEGSFWVDEKEKKET